MNTPVLQYQKYFLVFTLASLLSLPAIAQSTNMPEADSLKTAAIKSYFLLKINLETDPADIQNYLNKIQFKKQFQVFADEYASTISQMETPQAATLKWGISQAMDGNLDQSIALLQQALTFSAVKNKPNMQQHIYTLLAAIAELKGNYEQASAYLKKALDMPSKKAELYIQMGRIYALQGKNSEAEEYLLKKALPASNVLKNKQILVICYREIADMYNRRELFSQAKWFYLQSLTAAQKVNYDAGTIAAWIELGQFKSETGDTEQALKDWSEAEKRAIKTQQLPLLLKLKYNLAEAHRQCSHWLMAERYALEYEQLKDILLNPVL